MEHRPLWGLSHTVSFLILSILIISESQFAEQKNDLFKVPTKDNMRMAMYWLIQGCQPGDSLVFHFSGHGSQQRNYNGGEADGYDETLSPLDFETEGVITDEEINATIVQPLPHGVKLHAIIDACRSGTVLNLPFFCRMNRLEWAVCKVSHTDLTFFRYILPTPNDNFTSNKQFKLMLYVDRLYQKSLQQVCLIQAFERGQGTTYGSILNSVQSSIRNLWNDCGRGAMTSPLIISPHHAFDKRWQVETGAPVNCLQTIRCVYKTFLAMTWCLLKHCKGCD
ncbi:hypothetical protein HHK36_000451 [Tetracentron sinense]|uniref:Peptidase C14 caspase domain-containing protein n=1 Tax=Tetracentron sinense TaxID=13715 RepID=A0A835DQS4_TETSI|nr:hypothetical protein HHK36_000451 [Tetracentron sinense]